MIESGAEAIRLMKLPWSCPVGMKPQHTYPGLILSSQGQRLASLARLTSTWIAYIGPTHGVLQLVSSVASTALVVVTPGCLILASLATGISSSAAGIGFTGEATGETISKVAPLALVITSA